MGHSSSVTVWQRLGREFPSEPVAHGLLQPCLGSEFFEFVHRPPLDLTDSFLADPHLDAEFSKGSRGLAIKSKAGHDNPSFPRLKFLEKPRKQVFEPGDLFRRTVLGGFGFLDLVSE